VGYFCAAKPQSRDLQTVQPRSGVLLRLVIGAFIKPNFAYFQKRKKDWIKLLRLIFTAILLNGNGKEAKRLEFQFHQPSKQFFPPYRAPTSLRLKTFLLAQGTTLLTLNLPKRPKVTACENLSTCPIKTNEHL
jgi:hypothetical protein